MADQAADGARQEDADQEPPLHRPHHPPPFPGRGEMGGEREQQLRGDRRDPQQETRQGQQPERRGEGHPHQGDDHRGEHRDHEPSPFHHVAQGCDQEQPEGISHLRQHRDVGDPALRDVQVPGNLRQQRLDIVQVGDRDAATDRHQKGCATTEASGDDRLFKFDIHEQK